MINWMYQHFFVFFCLQPHWYWGWFIPIWPCFLLRFASQPPVFGLGFCQWWDIKGCIEKRFRFVWQTFIFETKKSPRVLLAQIRDWSRVPDKLFRLVNSRVVAITIQISMLWRNSHNPLLGTKHLWIFSVREPPSQPNMKRNRIISTWELWDLSFTVKPQDVHEFGRSFSLDWLTPSWVWLQTLRLVLEKRRPLGCQVLGGGGCWWSHQATLSFDSLVEDVEALPTGKAMKSTFLELGIVTNCCIGILKYPLNFCAVCVFIKFSIDFCFFAQDAWMELIAGRAELSVLGSCTTVLRRHCHSCTYGELSRRKSHMASVAGTEPKLLKFQRGSCWSQICF